MIKINGKYIRNIPEQVGKNKRDIFQLDTDLSALEVKVNEALAGVFHYKGSVATYADLPASDNEVGDVYNVIDTGKNYAWDGSIWDDLGGLVDLSNYYTKAEANAEFVDLDSTETISGEKTISDNTYLCFGSTGRMRNSSGAMRFYYNYNEMLRIGNGDVVISASTFRPQDKNTLDIGSSTYAWKDLYLAGEAYLYDGTFYAGLKAYGNSNQLQFYINQYNMYNLTATYFAPSSNNARDLGTTSNKFKDLHLAGIANLQTIKAPDNQNLTLQTTYGYAIIPNADDSTNLGTNSMRFRNVHISNELRDGTNAVTIADLAALITYAKGQGWIS